MTFKIKPYFGKVPANGMLEVFDVGLSIVLPGFTKNPIQPKDLKYSGTLNNGPAQFFFLTVHLSLIGYFVELTVLKTTGDYDARAATADKRAATKAQKKMV